MKHFTFSALLLGAAALVVFPKNPLHWDRVKAPAVEFPQVGPMFQNMAPLAGISTPGLSRGPSGKDFWERPLAPQALFAQSWFDLRPEEIRERINQKILGSKPRRQRSFPSRT